MTIQVAAIIGDPVVQSLSPAMHNAVFHQRITDWTYVAMEVHEDALAGVLQTLGGKSINAFSVTMPHKEKVFEMLSTASNDLGEVDESAKAAQSVNTIAISNGRMIGSNTDGDGCCNAIEQAGVGIAGSRVVVVGAGGTARAIVATLARRGASDIAVINRTESRAQDVVASVAVARIGNVDDIATANILINATSVGMGSQETPVDAAQLHSSLVVLDAVYHPLETTLLRDAKRAGAKTVDGLWMLVHQGALQQLAWFKEIGDVQLMRQAALDELAHRDH
ncbi:MAG: shikimate dehydrogenase [Actinobacteria bacterium]|uniref:shikimate dehydrogenase (NADP(+)) n=1 Tax=freshwater metagenome TaxID=449393 RepID=A0A6J6XG72_9ZZZZ|nr:shikimate dehydrogenase [Actinomycetota bacterium]